MAQSIIYQITRTIESLSRRVRTLETQPWGYPQHWAYTCSVFQILYGLRGFWPMSASSGAGNAIDISGHGSTLTRYGNPIYGLREYVPYIHFDGVGDYLLAADSSVFDITGLEDHIEIDKRGLTMGGWFYFDILSSASASASIRRSVSPSASTSPSASASISPSRSVSSSVSPSLSISASRSLSASSSISISASRSLSPSASASISRSASISPSGSSSPSSSASRSISRSISPSSSVSPSPSSAPAGHVMSLMGKWNITTENRSYLIYYDPGANAPIFAVSDTGLDADKKTVTGGQITVEGQWHFIVARYKPGTELAVFVDDLKYLNDDDTITPSVIYSSSASFIIGQKDEGVSGTAFHGGSSLNFLCSAALPDNVIYGLFRHTRTLFGV